MGGGRCSGAGREGSEPDEKEEGQLVDWSGVWLLLLGRNWLPLFQKPCSVMADRMTLLAFPTAIRSVCLFFFFKP